MTTAPQTTAHAQRVDELATHILATVEAAAPIGSPDGDTGTEALLAALIRRVGPFGYSGLSEWIPLARAR